MDQKDSFHIPLGEGGEELEELNSREDESDYAGEEAQIET